MERKRNLLKGIGEYHMSIQNDCRLWFERMNRSSDDIQMK